MTTETASARDYRSALQIATALAQQAGTLIREQFFSPEGIPGHGGHADVDTAAERHIRAGLASAFPNHGQRGEELSSENRDSSDKEEHVWVIDPHDGTSDATKGARGAAVSIALLRGGTPVLGVVYAYAAPGGGDDLVAWAEGCGPVHRQGCSVDRLPWKDTRGSDVVVLMSRSAEKAFEQSIGFASPARIRCLPSIAYRLALVATGDAEAATSFNGPVDWDYAGGHALVIGAGGVLIDGSGTPVRYTSEGLSSVGIACVGGSPALLKAFVKPPERIRPAPVAIMPRFDLTKPSPGKVVADDAMVQRACGCLMGQLAGDSLGAYVEFQGAETIRQKFPDGLRTLQDGGHWDLLAGQPTDDSELALMLARSIIKIGQYDPAAAAEAYGYWHASAPFDVGTTTRRALQPAASALSQGGNVLQSATKAASTTSESNGSLMRISPLGILGASWNPADVFATAMTDSMITHNSAVCREATGVFAVAVSYAINAGNSPAEVHRQAIEVAKQNDVDKRIIAALEAAQVEPPDSGQFNGHRQGMVLVAFQNAFFQLLHAPNLEQGVVDTVMRGGDTDTNAAIAGSLLGAVYGLGAMPAQWTRSVLSCCPLQGVAGVRHPRPRDFWPVDALAIAERLLWLGLQSQPRSNMVGVGSN